MARSFNLRGLAAMLILIGSIAASLIAATPASANTNPTDYLRLRNLDGRYEEFTIGNGTPNSCALYHRWQQRPGDDSSWTGRQSLGGCLNHNLNLNGASNPDGRLEIFAIANSTYDLFHIWQAPSTSSGWSSWQTLKGGQLTYAPNIYILSGGLLSLLGPGTDGYTWCIDQSPSSPGGWGNWRRCVASAG
jgi:hypothetical protein